MYLGPIPPKYGEDGYIVSIIVDGSSTPPEFFAETKLGSQAQTVLGDDLMRFGSYEELVAYLRACVRA
jgi:hypothetical protein